MVNREIIYTDRDLAPVNLVWSIKWPMLIDLRVFICVKTGFYFNAGYLRCPAFLQEERDLAWLHGINSKILRGVFQNLKRAIAG